jgi:N-acyl-D-aspartate/D-glutamate deacylase
MGESILIRGGTVVDGTGTAPVTADVLVEDGKIAEVGRIDRPGASIVDADGLLVTPGWVDTHTHYDGQVYWDPLMTPSSWHGSTTAVMGNSTIHCKAPTTGSLSIVQVLPSGEMNWPPFDQPYSSSQLLPNSGMKPTERISPVSTS